MPFSRRAASTAAVFLPVLALASLSTPVGAVKAQQQFQSLKATETVSVLAPQTLPFQAEPAQGDQTEIEYTSLSQAVAAQDAEVDTDPDLRCLASAVYYESKGEPLEGQLAVAHVILNRAASGRFAPSVCGVVTQPGQFAFVRRGKVPTPSDCAQWREAVAVAKVAQNELWENPAPSALYFHARAINAGWRMTKAKVALLGNHVFYR